MEALAMHVFNNSFWAGLVARASSEDAHTLAWDDSLLPELRRGHLQVQESFVHAFWPVVEAEARRYGSLGGDREDLTGEGALALWESATAYRPSQHRTTFTTYVRNHIHQRVRRAYLAYRGHHGPERTVPLHPDFVDSRDESLSLAEWHVDISAAAQSLSDDDRRSIVFGSTGARTAGEKKRVQRARQRLRARMNR